MLRAASLNTSTLTSASANDALAQVVWNFNLTFHSLLFSAENENNLQSDAWRLFQLEKASACPGHDWQKFGTGNRKTLETDPVAKGIQVHQALLQALLDFHAKHYANIMGISVLGKVIARGGVLFL